MRMFALLLLPVANVIKHTPKMPIERQTYLSNPPVQEASMGIFFRVAIAGASLFASGELLKWFARDQSYNDVIKLITKEINYAECVNNKKTERGLGISCDVRTPQVYAPERVKTILNTYIATTIDDASLPEYDASNATQLQASASTIQEVSRRAGEGDEKTVRMVLGQLYWSTAQQRVSDTSFIRPRTARDNAHSRLTPAQYQKEEKGMFDGIGDTLETLGMVLVGGAVLVVGIIAYNEYKS
jgi:hypothetical protein